MSREQDSVDGRGSLALLTGDGRTLLGSARVTHDAVIAELIGSPLPRTDVQSLTRILRRVLGPGA